MAPLYGSAGLDGSQMERDGGSISLADTAENQAGRDRTSQWDTMR